MSIHPALFLEALALLLSSALFLKTRSRLPGLATWGFAVTQLLALHLHHGGWLLGSSVLRSVGAYTALILIQNALLKRVRPGSTPRDRWISEASAWVALLLPIAVMVGVKLTIPTLAASTLIGLSYVAFRLCHLALEVRNELVPCPSLPEQVGFALFFPVVPVGPLLRYSEFRSSWQSPDPGGIRSSTSALGRVVLGLAKYAVLSNIVNQLGYTGLIMDGLPHPIVDLAVSAVSYTLFIYLNFSGFCDVAIGSAQLIGIRVPENFEAPFSARNIKEFWNRWHITLSVFMRDLVFTPLSKMLTRAWGPRGANHAIAISVMSMFLMIGAWHGLEAHYLLFGAAHGAGVAANHYFGLFLKRRLSKEALTRYLSSRGFRRLNVALTFSYVCATFLLFALPLPSIAKVFNALR